MSFQLHGLGSPSHCSVIGDCPHPYPIFGFLHPLDTLHPPSAALGEVALGFEGLCSVCFVYLS